MGVFAGVLGLVMTAFNTLGQGVSPPGAVPSSDESQPVADDEGARPTPEEGAP